MKAYVNDTCIGCGMCNSICPSVFDMTDEGVAQAADATVAAADEASVREAIDSCPVCAIEEQ
ncbi:MAG: ferredoxin [bacterium]|nr:ferredoxin [bacterium]